MTSNLLTGKIMGDWLPITGQNFARQINAVGTFTGALNLSAGTAAEQRAYLAAVENEKSVLWIFQDSAPVWCGIIWDWPHMSILDNTLPLSASTMESLFSRRLILDDLVFADADVFDIFRGLAQYALGKTPNGQVAGFTMGTNESGIIASIGYLASNVGSVYDAWNDLIATYGFEYSIRPAVDPGGNVYMSLDLGFPTLGLPLASSGLAFSMPGNLLDYRWTRTGSTSANVIVATASNSGQAAALNENSDFETTIAPWTASNGATESQSTLWANTGVASILWTGNGSQSGPQVGTETISITPNTSYTLSCVTYSPQGWSEFEIHVDWGDEYGDYLSTSESPATAVPSDAATSASYTVVSPVNAYEATMFLQMSGTPSSSIEMLADTAVFALTTQTVANWQNNPPHGVDLVVLGDGYPLLESSASLSTVIVTSQAQINAYADGLLPAVTGTQLTPLLTLGADQIPAVKDIVLGSYCQFNATSPLHPALPDGSPGLQINGRVTGWTIYPPSAQQSEYSWLQLGSIEDLDGTTYTPFTGAS
jgi:hypothetical protein